MDKDLLSTLKTVCAAGHATEGYNSEANDRLNQLKDLGLLVVAYAPRLLSRHLEYRPTDKGRVASKEGDHPRS